MAWLVQAVGSFTYELEEPEATARLRARLERRGVQVAVKSESKTRGPGTILVARCVTRCLSLGLWHCWSDVLEFELKPTEARQTRILVTAIPNLLRTGLRDGERATDVLALVAELQTT